MKRSFYFYCAFIIFLCVSISGVLYATDGDENYQMYLNEVWGVSFLYPVAWFESETSNLNTLHLYITINENWTLNNPVGFLIMGSSYSKKVSVDSEEIRTLMDNLTKPYKVLEEAQLKIGKRPAKVRKAVDERNGLLLTLYFVTKGKRNFTIVYMAKDEEYYERYSYVAEKVISTWEFTKSAVLE